MVKQSIYIVTIILLTLFSCHRRGRTFSHNKKLVSFSSKIIFNSDQYLNKSDSFFSKLNNIQYFKNEFGSIDYKEGLVTVKYLTVVNDCGKYVGDMDISNDTIFLHSESTSLIECASGRIDEFSYSIKNPENKKFVFVKN